MQPYVSPIGSVPSRLIATDPNHAGMRSVSLYDRVGGRPTLERVHALLYSRIYADPVLKQFFKDVPRDRQEKQLTDFMSGALGGPKAYVGKHPRQAHTHLYITPEMFDTRHHMLAQSLIDAKVPHTFHDEWLRTDRAFRRMLVKGSVQECTPRFNGEAIITANIRP
jgi:hemoglobin